MRLLRRSSSQWRGNEDEAICLLVYNRLQAADQFWLKIIDQRLTINEIPELPRVHNVLELSIVLIFICF